MEADPAGSIHPYPAVRMAQVPAGVEIYHVNYTDTQQASGLLA